MVLSRQLVAQAIDTAPYNCGLKGDDWLAFDGNVAITFDNGDVVLFDDEADGVYQIHVLFKSRGREAILHVKQACATVFAEHGATTIFGLVPDFRRDVKLLARWTGFKSAGVRATDEGPCELFVLSNAMRGILQ